MQFSLFFRKFLITFSSIALTSVVYAENAKFEVKLTPSATSKASGSISFTVLDGGKISIEGDLSGLTPGHHGMHIHMNGDCSDASAGFKKSGGHFNPDGTNHGSLMDGHVGDLGNILVDQTGKAHFKIETSKFNLIKNEKHSILGRAIVIHSGEDDEKSNPAGNSGERVLCGVIP